VSICSALGIWGQSSFERALSSYDADVRICFSNYLNILLFQKVLMHKQYQHLFQDLCWNCSFTQPNCLCFHQGDGYLFYADIWALTRMFCHLWSCFWLFLLRIKFDDFINNLFCQYHICI
jgi:hypothetical protein